MTRSLAEIAITKLIGGRPSLLNVISNDCIKIMDLEIADDNKSFDNTGTLQENLAGKHYKMIYKSRKHNDINYFIFD